MNRKRIPYRFLLIAALLFAAAGCSIEKNTGTTRFYHSLTSRYNIYFNAKESFIAGKQKVEQAYKDDYSELLNLFEYSIPAMAQVCSADMDRAIQKASKVISLKSMTAKPEIKKNAVLTEKDEEFMNRREYNKWVEKSYLLMGKARTYKQDYELAKATFSYSISYATEKTVRTESAIWMARVYAETGNLNEAHRLMRETELAKSSSETLFSLYYTSQADLHMRQKRYEDAARELEKGFEHTKGKRNRYRLAFLIAQLYDKTGDNNSASAWYRKVINMNPPYEVEFNARINLAGAFNPSQGNPDAVKKELEKMIRNPKNKDYLDQIYFAVASLYRKEGKNEKAVEFYKKSAAAGTSNNNQKGKTFLALAEYYFSIPDYINSGKYYDSVTIFLDTKYPGYDAIKSKALNLKSLVARLSVIQREDSLQKVAGMSETERNILIATIIENVRKAEAEVQASGQTAGDRYNLGQYYENERRFQGNIEQEGKWYFYNQAALTFGRTEFRRRWGDRRLEDNWRRLNKARVSVSDQQEAAEGKENGRKDTLSVVADNKKPEFYLRDLPLNDSLLKISNGRIASALLEAGKIYHESFGDNAKAVETLESLFRRFPGSSDEPEALYTIYKIHKQNNNQLAEVFRQRLVEKYPENEYTLIITDPSYYTRKLEAAREAEKLYKKAYDAWMMEEFAVADSLCNEGISRHPRHELSPKFMLLKSYCTARTSGEKAFKDDLAAIVNRWPGTPEAEKASELISFLNQEIPELKIEEERQIAKELYIDDRESPHLFGVVIMDPSFNLNQATFDIISYNIDNYTNRNFRSSGALIENKYIMLTVSGFRDLREALEYYRAFRPDREIRNPAGAKIITFIIGTRNLETLEKDKDPERYRLFFMENYPVSEEKKQ